MPWGRMKEEKKVFKTDKKNRIKLQTNIDSDLHHRFKAACFLSGKGMNEVLTELMTWWLESDEGDESPRMRSIPRK